ncbi:MAG TPA: hypothetical protein VGI83_02090, partial [Gemmatimonadales bacterium]
MRRTFGCLALLLVPAAARAQSGGSVADSSPFRALTLPAPNTMRTGAGRPGPGYWQQQVDYRITATLDLPKNELRGAEVIHYVNHSPETLSYLWLVVEQNICASGSVTEQLHQPPLVFQDAVFDFSCKGFKGGLTLEHVRVGADSAMYRVEGTQLRIALTTPLAPGAALDLDIAWHFRVPAYGAGRMGRDGSLYEMAQWYPRVAVFDDVHGLNHEPYIGAGEFYLEYGHFDVSLTL